jgi:hypothetical protein
MGGVAVAGGCRHVTLLQLPTYGLLADTPGFNQPALEKLSLGSVADCFPEIRSRLSIHTHTASSGAEKKTGREREGEEEALLVSPGFSGKCTFSNCTHRDEPGCVVRGDWERYQFYLDLYDEVRAALLPSLPLICDSRSPCRASACLRREGTGLDAPTCCACHLPSG